MSTTDRPPVLSALACGDEQPFTGFLCRVVGPHDLHDYDGTDPWTDTAPITTEKD